jgi:hypothetical protein
MGVFGEPRELGGWTQRTGEERGSRTGGNVVGIHLQWVGVDDVLAKLANVKPYLVARCLKPAIDKAGRLVARTMKSMISRRKTGLLKASIGIRTSPNWRKGKVYAIIGPRRSFKSKNKVTTVSKWRMGRIKRKGFEAFANPTRYAHLIEFGHAKGKGKGAAKPYPFMRPAWQATKNAAEQVAASTLRSYVSRLIT